MAEVRLNAVHKSYGDVPVLFDVSLSIRDSEFVVFVGPSGCGKSTLLRMIAGLEEVTAGTITIGGQDVTLTPPSERGVAMVFQSYALYPHMSVRGNMEFGLKINGVGKAEREGLVQEAARILQLEAFLERKPAQLSGGQRQRVAIGRAIVKKPRVFLFDEPLSNLDAALRIQMRVELETLHKALGSTMIYVTHDQVEAMTMADTIAVMNQGRVEQIGPPLELYKKPQTRFVAGFIGAPSMNFIQTSLDSAGADGLTLRYGAETVLALADVTVDDNFSGPITLGIRPEHMFATDPDAGILPAKVYAVEALGGESYVHADTELGDRLVLRADGETLIVRGEIIGIGVDASKYHLFSEDGSRLERSISADTGHPAETSKG